jgi:hypothetical protein
MWSLHDQLPFRLQRALRTLVHLVRAWKLLPFNLQLAVGLLGLLGPRTPKSPKSDQCKSGQCAAQAPLQSHPPPTPAPH